jgi:hypothetical protein
VDENALKVPNLLSLSLATAITLLRRLFLRPRPCLLPPLVLTLALRGCSPRLRRSIFNRSPYPHRTLSSKSSGVSSGLAASERRQITAQYIPSFLGDWGWLHLSFFVDVRAGRSPLFVAGGTLASSSKRDSRTALSKISSRTCQLLIFTAAMATIAYIR